MKKLSLVLILFAVSSLSFAFSPQAATPIKADIPISFTTTFPNPCTGELVTLTYTGDISIRGVINGNRVNITEHFNVQLDGVGLTSGAKYTGHISQNLTQNGSLNNGQLTINDVLNANLNVSGGQNNVKESASFHVTVNANGDVTSFNIDGFTQTCQ